ncbi:MAG: sensor histidine kinase [Jatrophihabitans sp.]|nr:MAG: sensor histidine kinase [Jatrophihabitans sp.]
MSVPDQRPVALTLLRQAEHALFAGLLALGAGQSIADGRRPWASGTVAALVLCWYAAGALAERRRSARAAGAGASRGTGPLRGARLWLAVLTAGWIVLVILSAGFVWLAFPLFLLLLQLLPLRVAIPVVVVLVAGAVATVAVHQGGVSLGVVAGPLVGAAVAVVIIVVYRQLRDEAERRALLLAELRAAQERVAAAERYAGTLAERDRLANEIHDTVAQGLASILLLLRSVRSGSDALPVPARRQLDAAVDAAKGALEDTRRVVRALAPAQLAGRSLTDALARLVEDARPVGIGLELEVDGDPYELPVATAVALLRTAQGALGNVIAHSMARHARLTLTFQPDRVSLDIADDGRGFDPGATAHETTAGTGIGLEAMRSRLAEVGGTLAVESAPGAGTAVSASIPTDDIEESHG